MKILFFDINPSPMIKMGILPAFEELGFEVEMPRNRIQFNELKYPECIKSKLTIQERYDILYKSIKRSDAEYVFLNGANQYYQAIPDACRDFDKKFIYWATEDPVLFDYMLPVVKQANLVLSTAIECVNEYKKMGLNAHLMMFGCNPNFHKLGKYNKKYDLDLILQASFYPNHKDRLKGYDIILDSALKAMKEKNSFNVYGAFWNSYDGIKRLGDKNLYKGFHPNEDIPDICASSKIVLGIQCTCSSVTQQSMRSFEILSSGGFHLTQWSPSMDYWFENGKHLVTVKSKEEAYEKIKYYLKHDIERNKIAQQGYDYVRNNHTYVHRIKEAILTNL